MQVKIWYNLRMNAKKKSAICILAMLLALASMLPTFYALTTSFVTLLGLVVQGQCTFYAVKMHMLVTM